jgi:hypothetical protein
MCKESVSREQYDILSERCRILEEENRRLQKLLITNRISFQIIDEIIEPKNPESLPDRLSVISESPKSISKSSPLADRVQLFMSLFHGRDDVYALRWENKRSGKKGYSPACKNSWIPGVCPLPQKKCHQCSNPDYLPYTSESVERHLSKQCKANVICKEAIHQKFAIIDEKIVWYGSVNLLSFGASQESIIRIVTGSVARTLFKSIGIQNPASENILEVVHGKRL